MGEHMHAQLLMLAFGPGGGAAVDVRTGSLLRTHWGDPLDDIPALSRFDVVSAELRRDDSLPFPQDTVIATAIRVDGRMRGRKADRFLKPLVHPANRPLLGAPANSVPYWTISDTQPTLALVSPSAGPVVERDQRMRLRCRFRCHRLDHVLPLDDPLVDERLSHPTATRVGGGTLARALGWRPNRILVALVAPSDGLCHKVVAGLLPKP